MSRKLSSNVLTLMPWRSVSSNTTSRSDPDNKSEKPRKKIRAETVAARGSLKLRSPAE